jgi:hypothetical protein
VSGHPSPSWTYFPAGNDVPTRRLDDALSETDRPAPLVIESATDCPDRAHAANEAAYRTTGRKIGRSGASNVWPSLPLLTIDSDLDGHIGAVWCQRHEGLGSASGRAAGALVAAVEEMISDLAGGHAFSSA